MSVFREVVIENYANFKGRTGRRTFWMFFLGFIALLFLCITLMTFLGVEDSSFAFGLMVILLLAVLALACPLWGLQVRRLHDIGWSGWWFWGGFIFNAVNTTTIKNIDEDLFSVCSALYSVYSIFILAMCARDSQAGPNQYGPDPKGRGTFEDDDSLKLVEEEDAFSEKDLQ